VRIHTDAVVFSQEVDIKHLENLLVEKKNTGNLEFTVINRSPTRF
jgi:hypothetical protein